MNMETGEIKMIDPKEKPTLGHIQISIAEQKIIERFPEEVRPFELLWLRTWKGLKWDFVKAMQRKEAFRQGWNAAIFANAKGYVINEKEDVK